MGPRAKVALLKKTPDSLEKKAMAQTRLILRTLVVAGFLALACPASADPWATHKDHLPQLAHKIEESEQAIRHLLEEKEHTDDPAALREIMKGIVEKHSQLAQATKEYEDERLHIRFKHPDLAAVVERQYKHRKLRSVEEIQAAAGLDGRLDRLKEKVQVVFITPPREPAKRTESERAPASTATPDDDGPEKIVLTK